MNPRDLIELHQRRVDEMNGEVLDLPDNHSAHQLLQALYRCKTLPLRERARYATASLPYETPKLAVSALVPEWDGWVKRLEMAVEQSQKILEARKTGDGSWNGDGSQGDAP